MQDSTSHLLIGLVTYNDLSFLRETLPPLLEVQKRLSADVVIMDTAWNKDVREFIQKEFPSFEYTRHADGNIGYGASYNAILKQKGAEKYDLFWVTTSDVLVNPAMVERFVKRMRKDPSIAMASGKLYHWDFQKGERTRYIDTLGILAHKSHHFYDRGQGEEDRGQYDENLGDFFGISGASFFIRMDTIPALHGYPEVLFDPAFWMYKEDIDLSYRLRWLGARMELFPEVLGWHARTVANRLGQTAFGVLRADQGKKVYARMHSYRNHFLLLKNNFIRAYGWGMFLRVFCYEFLKGLYMLFRSPKAFFQGLKTLLFVRVKSSSKRVSSRQMLSYFD